MMQISSFSTRAFSVNSLELGLQIINANYTPIRAKVWTAVSRDQNGSIFYGCFLKGREGNTQWSWLDIKSNFALCQRNYNHFITRAGIISTNQLPFLTAFITIRHTRPILKFVWIASNNIVKWSFTTKTKLCCLHLSGNCLLPLSIVRWAIFLTHYAQWVEINTLLYFHFPTLLICLHLKAQEIAITVNFAF